MSNWISVNDRLPEVVGLFCWVWSADWAVDAEPETDEWEGHRGELGQWHDGEKFIRSGWRLNCGERITHWRVVQVPEPPRRRKNRETD